ncbi:hypothetical protein TVNIR_0057 [Thioalkalivibrio nitratireducens DSM 14787]|uniref:Uncharacterized protein n=1 Tax=Thioalkalivibrio nitratireducens (strain DSM 14787 / UNIQEM 213 / ALEN2) TaxID=1255043 RepID=L0DS07_THIND|nr:hypothetical protein TVNIR_0057 [Thioalkalivibrio nitratireducens DSM 14787]
MRANGPEVAAGGGHGVPVPIGRELTSVHNSFGCTLQWRPLRWGRGWIPGWCIGSHRPGVGRGVATMMIGSERLQGRRGCVGDDRPTQPRDGRRTT